MKLARGRRGALAPFVARVDPVRSRVAGRIGYEDERRQLADAEHVGARGAAEREQPTCNQRCASRHRAVERTKGARRTSQHGDTNDTLDAEAELLDDSR